MESKSNKHGQLPSKEEVLIHGAVILGLFVGAILAAGGRAYKSSAEVEKWINKAIITETSVPPGVTPKVGFWEQQIRKALVTTTPTPEISR